MSALRQLRRRYGQSAGPADADKEFTTRGVLGGAYKGGRASLKAMLTHTVPPGTERSLCRGVKDGNMADSYSCTEAELQLPPTCPKCLARDPRFARAKTK